MSSSGRHFQGGSILAVKVTLGLGPGAVRNSVDVFELLQAKVEALEKRAERSPARVQLRRESSSQPKVHLECRPQPGSPSGGRLGVSAATSPASAGPSGVLDWTAALCYPG